MNALANNLPCQHIKLQNPVHLVPEQFDAHCPVVVPGRKDLDDITPHPEIATFQHQVIPLILHGDQPPEDGITVGFLPLVQGQHHLMIAFRGTQAIDAGHAGHDNHITPLKERAGSRVPQLINLVIDRSILLDICIRRGNIGLRLVIIIIADKISYIIVREKSLELAGQLCRQRLVVGNDQGRPLHLLNQLGYGKSLARAGSPQQHLGLLPVLDACRQILHRLRLIPHRLKGRHHLEGHRLIIIKIHIIQLWKHFLPSLHTFGIYYLHCTTKHGKFT